VGWSLKPRMTSDIVTDALTMAWFRRKPEAGLLHHSDRGSQYASYAFQDKLKEYGMVCSMSRKGDCWDNAPTESWFGSFKNERVYGERFATRAECRSMAFEYIEVFYNRRRLHSTLGYKSPKRFLEDWLNRQPPLPRRPPPTPAPPASYRTTARAARHPSPPPPTTAAPASECTPSQPSPTHPPDGMPDGNLTGF